MIRVPPQHQTDPAKAPGVWRNPDTSFDRYPYMKHSTAEPTNNVKQECCGNPLRTGPNGRGCDNCPPVKMFDDSHTVDSVNKLLLTLRIAHDGYPPSEARYGSIAEFLKEYHAV